MASRNGVMQKCKFETIIQEKHSLMGKISTCRRGSTIWNIYAPPNRCAEYTGPKSGGKWTTRTCWRSWIRSRCDYLWFPAWAHPMGYDDVSKPVGISTDHDLIVARIDSPGIRHRAAGKSERMGPQSCRHGEERRPSTRTGRSPRRTSCNVGTGL